MFSKKTRGLVTSKNAGFAEALETLGEKNAKLAKGYASCKCNQSLLSPYFFSIAF